MKPLSSYEGIPKRNSKLTKILFRSISSFLTGEVELIKSLGPAHEETTDSAISTALDGVGVANHETILRECNEVIEPNRDVLRKRYIHREEEAVLITTYTYSEKNGGDEENTPYRKLNSMLWSDNIQDQIDQIDNPKSYLRLLLRALRKLPRTEPQTLYRGIKNDEHEYKIGKELLWKGFSSTSTSMRATKFFLTNKDTGKVEGILFEVRAMWGYSISDFSKFPTEQGKNDKPKYQSLTLFLLLLIVIYHRNPSGTHAEVCCEEGGKAG